MRLSRAEVLTSHAVSYLRQLCEHWAQEFPVEFDDAHGKITLPKAYVTLMSSPTMLSVYLEITDATDQDRMEEVVAEQLQKIASAHVLAFHWLHS